MNFLFGAVYHFKDDAFSVENSKSKAEKLHSNKHEIENQNTFKVSAEIMSLYIISLYLISQLELIS